MKRTIQVVLGLAIFVGIVFLALNNGSSSGAPATDPLQVRAEDWTKGNATAPLTIIEYADFQCPACRVYSTWVNALATDYSGKVRIVYRYFPLPSHKHARISAQAAEAAGRQGKFWEMHTLLFDSQDEWSDLSDAKPKFEEYATKIGLDMVKYRTDLTSSAVEDRVSDDYNLGVRMRVNATPTLFLNGIKADSPRDYESLKKLVDTMLQAG